VYMCAVCVCMHVWLRRGVCSVGNSISHSVFRGQFHISQCVHTFNITQLRSNLRDNISELGHNDEHTRTHTHAHTHTPTHMHTHTRTFIICRVCSLRVVLSPSLPSIPSFPPFPPCSLHLTTYLLRALPRLFPCTLSHSLTLLFARSLSRFFFTGKRGNLPVG